MLTKFMGWFIAPIVVLIMAALPMQAATAQELVTGRHALVLLHLPTGEAQAVALFRSRGACVVTRDIVRKDIEQRYEVVTIVPVCVPYKTI